MAKTITMGNQQLRPITIASAKKTGNGEFIDDDVMLFNEFADVPFPTNPRIMDCILVGLCTQGKAQYSIDTVHHEVSPGDLIVILHGQVTGDFLLSRDFSGKGLMISYDFFYGMVSNIHEISSAFLVTYSHPIIHLGKEELEIFEEYFELVSRKITDYQHHYRRDVVRSLLTAMLYDIGNSIYQDQLVNDKRQTRGETIFIDFMHLLEQNFRRERRVSWYGQQLCITPKYLSESIKQVSKRTPNDWIDSYVVREIRVQLKNTTKSIKEIAQEMNFANQSFFGKYFREHTGVSPSEYRRK